MKNITFRTGIPLLAPVLACLLLVSTVEGVNMFPLEPPDTIPPVPRTTLQSFLHYTNVFYRATSGMESVLQLCEIVDRIQLPELADIPDKKQLSRFSFSDEGDTSGRKENKKNLVRWRIPHTEIVIGKVEEGSRLGSFLFTPETVKQMDRFYEKVRKIPYKSGAAEGIYEQYIYSSGWLIPSSFLINSVLQTS